MAVGIGRSLPFWKDVVLLQLHRLTDLEAQLPAVHEHFASNFERYAANNPVMSQWTLQMQADAHFLIVAIRHVIKFGQAFQNITRSADMRPGALIRDFLSQYPEPEKLRNILEHFDEYSVGGKIDPRRGLGPDMRGVELEGGAEHIMLIVGNRKMPLLSLGQAAARLACGLDALWEALLMNQPPSG